MVALRSLLSVAGMICLAFVAACSGQEASHPVFDKKEELMERELGDANVLDAKTWKGNTYLLYGRNQGTPGEEVAVGVIRRVDGGYAWISSPSFRIDVMARFDFDPRDGSAEPSTCTSAERSGTTPAGSPFAVSRSRRTCTTDISGDSSFPITSIGKSGKPRRGQDQPPRLDARYAGQ